MISNFDYHDMTQLLAKFNNVPFVGVFSTNPLKFLDVLLSGINFQTIIFIWRPRADGVARKLHQILENRYTQPLFIFSKNWIKRKTELSIFLNLKKRHFLLPHYVRTKEKYFLLQNADAQKETQTIGQEELEPLPATLKIKKGSEHTSTKLPIVASAITRSIRRILGFLSSFEGILFLLR